MAADLTAVVAVLAVFAALVVGSSTESVVASAFAGTVGSFEAVSEAASYSGAKGWIYIRS